MKIACIGYRDWAIRIYEELLHSYKSKHKFLIVRSKESFNEDSILKFNPDIILWYGWSWKVDEKFTQNFTSIMLHPSELPKYRGGSPIQNQIINNEKNTCVTLFKMTKNLDDGDVYIQLRMSLSGTLKEIFNRISDLGYAGTCEIIDNDIKPTKQDDSRASYFKRRKPSDSEITIEEIKFKDAQYLYNKVRMLADPYPNAFIKTCDNKELIILDTKIRF